MDAYKRFLNTEFDWELIQTVKKVSSERFLKWVCLAEKWLRQDFSEGGRLWEILNTAFDLDLLEAGFHIVIPLLYSVQIAWLMTDSNRIS